MALADLIKLNKHRPTRKMYIKRRLASDGSYEADWVRIDNWLNKQRIIDWGEISINIDEQPGVVASFDVSELAITTDNYDGSFNVETYEFSIWHPETTYLNRRYTKLKIETAYLDADNAEIGTANDFEGLIESVTISEDGLANIIILSYQSIFTRYPISDLSLSGSMTAEAIIAAICNQAKITIYMPYVAPSTGTNYTVTNAALLKGSYWDILQELAFKSDSTIYLEVGVFKILPRNPGSVVWNFKGSGSDAPNDIFGVDEYDDEGIGKIRVFWQEEDGSTFAKSVNANLLLKYLSEPELVDLTNIDSGDKQDILDALLVKWQQNRPIILFSTKYLLNQISLLDKLTIDIRGRVSPGIGAGGFRWGSWNWGDGSTWGKEIGGIIISSATEWMATQIIKNFNNWSMSIRAEKVI